MPFGPYQNWDACILDQTKKGRSKESAMKICGAIKAKTEKQMSEQINVFNQDIDLSELSEEVDYEILTTAKQTDSRYGDFSFSKEELEEMAKNFNDGIPGMELAVDINHDPAKKAYAWIRPESMYVAQSKKLADQYSLYAKLYRFTPEGQDLVKTGAYRYFSLQIRPIFNKWINGVKKTFKNVVYGLALTNSPVIKDMAPTFSENNLFFNLSNMDTIQMMLSELSAKAVVTKAEKTLLKKAVTALSEEEQTAVATEVAAVEAKPEQTEEEIAAQKEAEEKAAAEKALAEKNLTETQQMEKKFAEQAKELSELKEKITAETIETQLKEISLSETVTTGVHAEQKDAVKAFMVSLSDEQRDQFVGIIKAIKSVDLAEKGSCATHSGTAAEEMDKQAKMMAEKEGITYGQALKKLTK